MSTDLERIALQERVLCLPAFNADVAWNLGAHLRELGVATGANLLIDVSRVDQQLFACSLGETTPDNAEWVRRKRNVVRRFQRSSYAVGLSLQAKGKTLAEQYGIDERDYATHGGSFPVRVHGSGFVGSVTVSGLPQREDHALAVQALCRHLHKAYEEFALPAVTG